MQMRDDAENNGGVQRWGSRQGSCSILSLLLTLLPPDFEKRNVFFFE
jgi:hypothetical protein